MLAVRLLLHCQLDHLCQPQTLLLVFQCLCLKLVPFLGHFSQSVTGLAEEQVRLSLALELQLKRLVLLDKEEETMLHVLVALLKHLVVLR